MIQEITCTLSYGGIFMIYEHNPYDRLTRYSVNTCPFNENTVLLRKTEVNKIKFSVIIPCYYEEEVLPLTLEKLKTYPNDWSSKDECESIEFLEELPGYNRLNKFQHLIVFERSTT